MQPSQIPLFFTDFCLVHQVALQWKLFTEFSFSVFLRSSCSAGLKRRSVVSCPARCRISFDLNSPKQLCTECQIEFQNVIPFSFSAPTDLFSKARLPSDVQAAWLLNIHKLHQASCSDREVFGCEGRGHDVSGRTFCNISSLFRT